MRRVWPANHKEWRMQSRTERAKGGKRGYYRLDFELFMSSFSLSLYVLAHVMDIQMTCKACHCDWCWICGGKIKDGKVGWHYSEGEITFMSQWLTLDCNF